MSSMTTEEADGEKTSKPDVDDESAPPRNAKKKKSDRQSEERPSAPKSAVAASPSGFDERALAKGIAIEEESVAEGLSRFFIRDPAGNRVEIGQR